MNVNDAIGQLSEEELRAVDAAVAVIQADCSYCIQDMTTLLRTIAIDLLHTGQVLSRCRGLPEDDSTKERRVELMTNGPEAICRLCQEATRRCVGVWQYAKKL